GVGGPMPLRFNLQTPVVFAPDRGRQLVTRTLLTAAVLAATALGTRGTTVHADEGMWLLDAPPRRLLEGRYRFKLTDDWRDRAMKASVRFNNGGSGGFVSPEGLIVTNHHIGAGSIQKVSPKDRDYLRDGYLARSRKEELKCPDLELNVLQEIVDVTKQVNEAVKGG